jgi:aspartyl/glutamyl-tRNA(Asn/Gln) amidotransferase C subunit
MENRKIDVEAIARLARLDITETEKQRLEKEMLTFADFAVCLEKYGTCDDISDAPSVFECGAREDECLPYEFSDRLLTLSAEVKDGCISVPITIDKEDSE